VIAGPNGAGKTTFAREYLPKDAKVIHFVNADLIASGLSPLRPELAAMAAGRVFLAELGRLAKLRVDFAFETTMSGLVHLRRLKRWKSVGYRIEIVFLSLSSPQLALSRIAGRVKQGGHNVPRADVLRRFVRGWRNFEIVYRPLADSWTMYDSCDLLPRFLESGPEAKKRDAFSASVGRALRRAARNARKTASEHGTPLYFWRDGKVVAEKP